MRLTTAAFLAFLFVTPACKPRGAGNVTRALSTEGGQGYQPDQAGAREAAIVRDACQGKNASLFRGTGSGDRVDYASAGSSAVEEGKPLTQIPWYEEARFFDGKWQLSAAIAGRKDIPECLRTATELTTKQLAIALGCDSGEACAVNPPPCQGESCNLATVQSVSGDAPSSDTGTGLALDDASVVRCVAASAGFQLTSRAGKPIGKVVDSEVGCKHLTGTYSGGLVCAWTGNGLLPARVSDGALIGNAGAAASNSLSGCASMVATADSGVVCSWNGTGFAPYRIAGDIRAVGSETVAPDLALCAEKTVVRGNRVCGWDGRDVRVFDLASLKVTQGVAAFDTYEACHKVLKRIATPVGMQQYAADLKAVDAPTQGAAGLNLAGEGAGPGNHVKTARGNIISWNAAAAR